MTPQVLAKLKAVAARYQELTRLVSDSAVQADSTKYRTYSKEIADLQDLVDRYADYQQRATELAEAREMAAGTDADLRALAAEEIPGLETRMAALEEEIRVLLIPKDPNDNRNVVLEIRAGTGGDEAALFASDLFRMYSRYAERQRWKVEVLSSSGTGVGGLKEAIATVEGKGVYRRLKHESGVHRVQRVPVTEASGRIHTSTATVAVLPEAEEVDIQIDQKDLRVDTFCSSGPGGQSVNTTYSAVRVTHIPTGIVVSQQDEKSQIKNRAKAMKVLRSRLYEMEMRKQQEAIAKERRGQVGTGERSEKIRTYNFKENRITDHRINFTMHQLDVALDGALDPLFDELDTRAEEAKLRDATEPPPPPPGDDNDE
jgi:peptide chain release factor 1